MFFLLPASNTRPSILTSSKGTEYHTKFARYCLGQVNTSLHSSFLEKIQKNKNFYKGNQWVETEDRDTFLKDDDNQDRNRLAIVDNIIRPMVEQYRGNAIRMNINFRIRSTSPKAVNRREAKLNESLHYSKEANRPDNPFGEAMKKQFPIGDNEAETRAIFKNTYTDDFAAAMNRLAKFIIERNNFEDLQVRIAEELALTGLGVMKGFEYAGHQNFEPTPSDTFLFDRSARKYDLSDAAFMGEFHDLSPAEIFESAPDLDDDSKTQIDEYCEYFSGEGRLGSDGSFHSGKVPVYEMYWRDGRYVEYGYVMDEFGYPYLTKINYVFEGEDNPRYTDKDLILNTSVRAKKLGFHENKLKRRLYVDELRMAKIIPREILASSSPNAVDSTKFSDIILDWGLVPYQDTENIEFNTVKWPYKCYCWGYIDGEIMSPIDDAIDPQRFINRVLSVAENQINNSRGAGMVYDKDMLDDEGQAVRNMNQSKPVGISAKGRGIQNAIGQYDSTVKTGTQIMFDIMSALKMSTQQTTGLNDALKGESTGSDQLVGVTQLMIQRGSLMQEPFYFAVTNIFKQCFQMICNVGKRIYADNERNLCIAVGDDDYETIKITKEMRLEDFRCFVKRENSDDMLRSAADQMLLQLKQLMLIDDKRFADLYGRSTPDEVGVALRSYSKEKEEIQRAAQKDSAQQEAALTQQANMEQQEAQGQAHEQTAREDVKDITKQQFDLKKEAFKGLGKIAAGNKKAEDLLLKKSEELVS